MFGFLKKKKEQKQTEDKKSLFTRDFVNLMTTFSEIFHPVFLQWWEVVIIVVVGILGGLGVGYLVGSYFKFNVIHGTLVNDTSVPKATTTTHWIG